jgi:hypothetical protein
MHLCTQADLNGLKWKELSPVLLPEFDLMGGEHTQLYKRTEGRKVDLKTRATARNPPSSVLFLTLLLQECNRHWQLISVLCSWHKTKSHICPSRQYFIKGFNSESIVKNLGISGVLILTLVFQEFWFIPWYFRSFFTLVFKEFLPWYFRSFDSYLGISGVQERLPEIRLLPLLDLQARLGSRLLPQARKKRW